MRDKRMTLKEAVSKFVNDGDNVGIGGFVDVRPARSLLPRALSGRVLKTSPFLFNPQVWPPSISAQP